MTHHFRRGGEIWKKWNLSFECPDPSPSKRTQKTQPPVEPVIFWDVSPSKTTEKTMTERKLLFSPLTPASERQSVSLNEEGTENEEFHCTPGSSAKRQKVPLGSSDKFLTPTSHRPKKSRHRINSVFDRRKERLEKSAEQEDLVKKIHETAMLHLQSNVDKYIKQRDDEKTRKRSQKEDGEESEGLFSPKTALERDAAWFTPSKRRKFFPDARLYGSSRSTTSQLASSDLNLTPKRSNSPMTSTPRHRHGHSLVEGLNVSPVERLTNQREERIKHGEPQISFDANEGEHNEADVANQRIAETVSPKEEQCEEKEDDVQPTEIYIIPEDSWDLEEDSF